MQHRIDLVTEAIAVRAAQEREAQEAQVAEQEAQRTVYVARDGTAEVYWYNQSSMPSNTNFDRVVAMTEAEALAQGKQHSKKE